MGRFTGIFAFGGIHNNLESPACKAFQIQTDPQRALNRGCLGHAHLRLAES